MTEPLKSANRPAVMRPLAWLTFLVGWLAIVVAGRLFPIPHDGLIALPIALLAICGFGLFSVSLWGRQPISVWRRASGTLAVQFGGILLSWASLRLGNLFVDVAPQLAEVRHFDSFAEALRLVATDPLTCALSVLAPGILALGSWLRTRWPLSRVVLLWLFGFAAFPLIVLLLFLA